MYIKRGRPISTRHCWVYSELGQITEKAPHWNFIIKVNPDHSPSEITRGTREQKNFCIIVGSFSRMIRSEFTREWVRLKW